MNKKLYNKLLGIFLEKYGITKEELYEKTKLQCVVETRYLFYYICVKRGVDVMSLVRLMKGDGFKMTYSNVLRGVKIAEQKIAEDPDYKQIINEIK
jgi:chromosomal replication initiation ATPase DnaA